MTDRTPLPYKCLVCAAITKASLFDPAPFCSACGSRALERIPESKTSKRIRKLASKRAEHYTDDE